MRVNIFGAATVLIAVTTSVHAASVPAKRASVCNGRAELCDRSYGNTTFVGAHDSFAHSTDPAALARDQEINITAQLNLGIRLLQAQAHEDDGELHFCHTSCALFDGGTVQDYLTTVKTWLDANPNEVLTFIFTNPEGLSIKDMWDPAFQNSGIANVTYVPPSVPVKQSDWPTLGQLIDADTRVVVFMDYGAKDGTTVPYIMSEFTMVWETPFSVTNASFPCSVNRTSGPLSDEDHMYMINHSLNINLLDTGIIISDPSDAPTTNGVPSILANAYGCTQFAAGRAPNFVLLDFVNMGQPFKAADILNGFS
ncbi:PLC-like phosphodiesterase [Neolentinus lepideus HHB14362 ss-1]|uniref:PLC-like phosphodiesterase n=1 Tax=Neolentinus lepideus HHB14362 ss-1 TaxID=1314782 RepID=A0A165NWX5_9AGAM|nr:PLC-like phosphodiesterase [Neolentinus lepideus HHB14362 ss-1]